VSYRETDHLRVLIANERRDRLALLAPIVAALGHEVIATPASTLHVRRWVRDPLRRGISRSGRPGGARAGALAHHHSRYRRPRAQRGLQAAGACCAPRRLGTHL